MDLRMMIVETGSSKGSVAKPKAPPAAPEAVANALCRISDPAWGIRRILRKAILRATSSPLVVAVEII
jgi:hypothetical protein